LPIVPEIAAFVRELKKWLNRNGKKCTRAILTGGVASTQANIVEGTKSPMALEE
jgi:hypothetical protein